MLNAKHLPTF